MNNYYYGADMWDNDVIVNDEFDSDQLDEDESYSWASGISDAQDGGCTANWRGWNAMNEKFIQKTQSKQDLTAVATTKIGIDKLVDLSARYIALNMPFELVETHSQPVPEELQLKITFASFPDNADDIRLYSCLANGNSDEYLKGEQLYNCKNVKNILQIGFHLSATVVPLCNTNTSKVQNLNVAVVCDRKRITSCHCSCSKAGSWCSHIVAICLCRIYEPQNVELRAPVSESLSKLQRDQLQKFAQYLISELPQQILPTAQKLIDELLKSSNNSINLQSGAPDPTAGSSTHDISVWCLDELILQENIHKTLSKFIIPSPHVVSDIDYLAHASSAASAEYTSLLRPLRGREPEGMWNLISIVKEMFRKHDKNSVPLLKLITNECVAIDQVLHLWFLVKVSPLYNDKYAFNGNNTNGNTNSNQRHSHNTPPVSQACAILLDEIVSLWRIACLNPLLGANERLTFKETLNGWHKQTYDKLRKFCNSAGNLHLVRRLDIVYFNAFIPAINSCQLSWDTFNLDSLTQFRRLCSEYLPFVGSNDETTTAVAVTANDGETTSVRKSSSGSEGFCEDAVKGSGPVEDTVFGMSAMGVNLDLLFTRCEALYAHGFTEHACVLAKILADYLLSIQNTDKNYDDTPDAHVTPAPQTFQSNILWRCALICTVLLESTQHTQLAFRIGLYAFEMPRRPVGSKAVEVKLFNQEQDLVLLLKRIPISQFELDVVRDRAQKIIKYSQTKKFQHSTCSNLVPIMMANFIFDIMCLNEKFNGNKYDEQAGFDAAVCALGYKPNVSETEYPIFCEGIRRQKGDLALTLLLTYKDDQARLLKIMEKILDKEIHVLFKCLFNPFQPNLKKIQLNHFNKYSNLIAVKNAVTATTPVTPQALPAPLVSHSSITIRPQSQQPQFSKSSSFGTSKPPFKYSAIDSVSSGWEESENETNTTHTHLLEAKYRLNKQINSAASNATSVATSGGGVATSGGGSGAIGSNLSSLNVNANKKFASLDSSAPETTSSDNSPTVNRKTKWQFEQTAKTTTTTTTSVLNSTITNNDEVTCTQTVDCGSGSGGGGGVKQQNESDDSGGESICSNGGEQPKLPQSVDAAQQSSSISVKPWSDSTFTETVTPTPPPPTPPEPPLASQIETVEMPDIKQHIDPKLDPSIIEDLSNALKQCNTQMRNDVMTRVTDAFTQVTNTVTSEYACNAATTATVTNTFYTFTGGNRGSNSRGNRKNRSPIMPNQPSEALAHFMFDFSKTVLNKAGGPASSSVFLNPNNTGPHRNLHVCAFLIALYALGLHNCVIPNWLSRTYSSHVSWINGQVAEIGYQAICILIECWEGHLTPAECALLADRVSRGRDTMAVKAAAELALSSLQFSHALNLQEIQRALFQCREQSCEMLQKACCIVENSLSNNEIINMNLMDILFEVAKRWEEVYLNSVQKPQQPVQAGGDMHSIQQHQAAASAAVAVAAVMQTESAIAVTSASQIQQQDTPLAQFPYLQAQQAPFAFAVQPLPYPQYIQQNIYMPTMYTAFGTILTTPGAHQPPVPQQALPPQPITPQSQNLMMSQQQQQQQQQQVNQYSVATQHVGNLYQSANSSYLFQNQPQHHMLAPQAQQKPVEVNNVNMEFLFTAFRVGMRALEALPKRADNSHQIKYLRSPSYGENVKWLLSLSFKLGTNNVQKFLQTVANVIQNPFFIQDLVIDSANYLSRYNPTQLASALHTPILTVLVQRCLNSYARLFTHRLANMTPNDHEDYINMIITARDLYYFTGNKSNFHDLMVNINRSRAGKKDSALLTKLWNALGATIPNYP